MKKIFSVEIGDFAPAQSTRSFTDEGYLLCKDARIAKAPQIRQYYGYEFENIEQFGFSNDQMINVFTSQAELFKPSVLKQLKQVDLTASHPPGNQINSSNWRDYHGGYAQNGRIDGDYLIADILIKDAELIALVQKNEVLEMSLGYAADLVFENGIADDGTPYQAAYQNFTVNHVALVKYGRCGGSCRIGDEKPETKKESVKTMEILVSGMRFNIGDTDTALADAIKAQNEKLADYESKKIKIGDQEFGLNEADAISAVVSTITQESADLKEKVQTLEANQITPEKIEAAAVERAAVVADAQKIVPDLDVKSCNCNEIKKAVIAAKAGDALVTAVLAGVAVGDADPSAIDTAFRALVATNGAAPVNYANTLQVKAGDTKPDDDKPKHSKKNMYKQGQDA